MSMGMRHLQGNDTKGSITLAFWIYSLDVRLTVEMRFQCHFLVFDTENDIKNVFRQ
jgi:hypothetical protein